MWSGWSTGREGGREGGSYVWTITVMTLSPTVDISRELPTVWVVLQEPLLTVVFAPDLILTKLQSEQPAGWLAVIVQRPVKADLLEVRAATEVDNPGLCCHQR